MASRLRSLLQDVVKHLPRDVLKNEVIQRILEFSMDYPWISLSSAIFLFVLCGPALFAVGMLLTFSCCMAVGFVFMEVASFGLFLVFLVPFAGFAAFLSIWITLIVMFTYRIILATFKYADSYDEKESNKEMSPKRKVKKEKTKSCPGDVEVVGFDSGRKVTGEHSS